MNAMFPTGFTAPTALYLSLFAVTLVVHAVFMHYVLAGSTYLAFGRLMGPRRCAVCGWQSILVDWLPFATGLAITAGVAPLLFVQILHGREFSTANLLLSHRWMAILPVLIVCFYLLYLQKSAWLARRRWVWRTVVASLACSGFIFIAWSWTENHLLMLDRDAWAPLYESGALRYASPGVLPRLALWFFSAFPTLAIELVWQGRLLGLDVTRPPAAAEVVLGLSPVRRLALAALSGVAGMTAAGSLYGQTLTAVDREALVGPLGGPWLTVAITGLVVQSGTWVAAAFCNRMSHGLGVVTTVGWLATLCGLVAARESIRLVHVDIATLAERHATAASISGFPVFLTCAALTVIAIVWCVVAVRAGLVR
jgi:hypothetical protein